jgi:hypothetical protein
MFSSVLLSAAVYFVNPKTCSVDGYQHLEGPVAPIFRVILLIIYPTVRCEIQEICLNIHYHENNCHVLLNAKL